MSPEAAFIVATVLSEEAQVPPAIVDENVVVSATQILCPPLSVPATGAAVTVTVLVAVAFGQPPVPKTV